MLAIAWTAGPPVAFHTIEDSRALRTPPFRSMDVIISNVARLDFFLINYLLWSVSNVSTISARDSSIARSTRVLVLSPCPLIDFRHLPSFQNPFLLNWTFWHGLRGSSPLSQALSIKNIFVGCLFQESCHQFLTVQRVSFSSCRTICLTTCWRRYHCSSWSSHAIQVFKRCQQLRLRPTRPMSHRCLEISKLITRNWFSNFRSGDQFAGQQRLLSR